ncbi:MAG TPA: toxin-antitoxin system HicB family antitoxin [Sporichthya sp.]|nr:toxin-antitoxin system HicB family antitoxin [Sporichthya sp.]
MHLLPYTTSVRSQLTAAAALGGESTRTIAEALATAAEPAVRLAVLEAVSAAADEITEALLDAPGSPAVAVRLDSDELRVEVRLAPAAESAPAPTEEGDNDARISLRLPESLKSSIETAARAEGVSVNTWLLRAANSALSPIQLSFGRPQGASPGRITGWING